MKTVIITVLSIVILGGIIGCAEQNKAPKVNDDKAITTLEGITFEVKYPGTEGINIDTRAIHDAPEYTIKKLWMCLFSKKDGKLVKEPIDICDPSNREIYKLETNTGARYTWTTKDFGEGDVFRFFFVANTEKPKVSVGSTTLEDLKKMILEKSYAETSPSSKDILLEVENQYYLPMSGQGYQDDQELVVTAPGRFVEVQLMRAVARIDIENQLPGFVIKKVELGNTWSKTFVALSSEKSHPDDAQLKSGIAPYTQVPSSGIAGADKVKPENQLKKAFYLYEGDFPSNTTEDKLSYVRITADWGDVKEAVYLVPFIKGKNHTPVPIVRNHLYKLLIKLDDETGKATFEFVEEPWTLHQLTEVFNLYDVSGENFIRTSTTTGLLTVYKYAEGEKTSTLKLHDNFTAQTKWNDPTIEAGGDSWLEASIDNKESKDATLTIKIKGKFDDIFSKTGGDSIHADYMAKNIIISTEAGEKYTIEVRLTKKELRK